MDVALILDADETDLLRKDAGLNGFSIFTEILGLRFVISTKEKSSQETRQRLVFRCGATCGDFSFRRNDIHNF